MQAEGEWCGEGGFGLRGPGVRRGRFFRGCRGSELGCGGGTEPRVPGLIRRGLVRRVFRPFRAGGLFRCVPGAMPRSITLRLFEAGLYGEGGFGEGGLTRRGEGLMGRRRNRELLVRGEVRWEGLLDKERPGVHDGVHDETVGFCRRSGRGHPEDPVLAIPWEWDGGRAV
jgi:hypothetical protein